MKPVRVQVMFFGESQMHDIEFQEIRPSWCDPMFRYLKVTWDNGEQTREFGKEEILETVIDFIDQLVVNAYHDEQRKKARTYNNYDEPQDSKAPVQVVEPTVNHNLIQENYTVTGSASHYQDIIPGYEYMDIMEHILGYEGVCAHLKGQIYKYMMRMGRKDSALQEATKVSWYSERLRTTIALFNEGLFPRTPKSEAITKFLESIK